MKHVILIVTGSIAAPKATELYKFLAQKYQVTVIMTPSASKFVRFSKNITIHQSFLDKNFYEKDNKIEHTNFALNHDLIVVYPTTMNFISKAALAIPDNLALATFLASEKPKIIFPAMNNNMYLNHSFQNNLNILQQDNNILLQEPEYGMLACQVKGIGRVKEPESAFKIIEKNFEKKQGLKHKIVLINYGATRTYLDDIRYITNNSSGKMGQAFIAACLEQQAKVIAIVGDISVPLIKNQHLTIVKANTNEAMLQAMETYYSNADIVFSIAALNDYVMAQKFVGKINKTQNRHLTLHLIPNIDILQTLGKNKKHQLLIGFSAQDNEEEKIAKKKMKEKNCDGIILNHIKTMGQDQSKITFYFNNLAYNLFGSKKQIAQDIINIIVATNNKE